MCIPVYVHICALKLYTSAYVCRVHVGSMHVRTYVCVTRKRFLSQKVCVCMYVCMHVCMYVAM